MDGNSLKNFHDSSFFSLYNCTQLNTYTHTYGFVLAFIESFRNLLNDISSTFFLRKNLNITFMRIHKLAYAGISWHQQYPIIHGLSGFVPSMHNFFFLILYIQQTFTKVFIRLCITIGLGRC